MPGLTGCVSGQSLNRGLLGAMIKPMLHRTDYQVHELVQGNFISAAIDLASDRRNGLIQSQDSRFTLVFYGALYESWAVSKKEILQNLLNRWTHSGWPGLADLNGEYLILVWDSIEEKLTIVNDRLGLLRFNYWHDHSTFAWGSEVKSLAVLAEVDRSIDEGALSELLIFGHLQENRTLLKSVKRLPPAVCLVWKSGQLSVTSYWKIGDEEDRAFKNSDEVLDGYEFHLREAVQKRLGNFSNLSLLLSGGLDSRAIAGALRSIRPEGQLNTWTYGHSHDHDTQFAKKIAKVIKSKHTSIDTPENFLSLYGENYAWLLDGTVSTDGSHRSVLIPYVNSETDALFNGFLGDVLGGSNLLERVLTTDTTEEVVEFGYQYYAVGYDDSMLKQILLPEVYSRVSGFAYEAFSRTIRSVCSEHPANRLGFAAIMRQCWGDARAQLELLGSHFNLAVPFADRDLFDFVSHLPLKYRIGRKAYINTIYHKYPELARVARSGDGLPLAHSRLRASFHWKWLDLQRKVLPKLTRGIFKPHSYHQFVHCDEWLRHSSRNYIESIMANREILSPYFDMDAMGRWVESYLNGQEKRDYSKAITALVSFAAFQRRLLDVETVGLVYEKSLAEVNL